MTLLAPHRLGTTASESMQSTAETRTSAPLGAQSRAREQSVLRITPAERHALRLLAHGKPIDDVAVALDVGSSAVESDLNELFARMGVSGIAAAVEDAFRRGLLVTEQSGRQAKEGQ